MPIGGAGDISGPAGAESSAAPCKGRIHFVKADTSSSNAPCAPLVNMATVSGTPELLGFFEAASFAAGAVASAMACCRLSRLP